MSSRTYVDGRALLGRVETGELGIEQPRPDSSRKELSCVRMPREHQIHSVSLRHLEVVGLVGEQYDRISIQVRALERSPIFAARSTERVIVQTHHRELFSPGLALREADALVRETIDAHFGQNFDDVLHVTMYGS